MIRAPMLRLLAVAAGTCFVANHASAASSSKPKEIVVVGSKIKETKKKKTPGLTLKRGKPSKPPAPAATSNILFGDQTFGGNNPAQQGTGAGGSARRR